MQEEKFINLTPKNGKIQIAEVDLDTLDVKIQEANQAYLDNEVVISDGIIQRQILKDELNKLIAIKEQTQ